MFKFRRPEPITPGSPWPNFEKSHVKIGRFDQKINFYTLYFFQIETKVIQIDLLTFSHVKQPDFLNIKCLLSYTQNCI